MGIPPVCSAVLRTATGLDRAATGADQRKPSGPRRPYAGSRHCIPSAGRSRAARATAVPRRASWTDSVAHQRTESAVALGIMLAIGLHLSQLASCVDARYGARLRADSRAGACAAVRTP